MTRCLLTGAGGFVGHHFLEHILVNTDWGVVATDSFRHKGVTDRIAQVLAGDPLRDDMLYASIRYRAERKGRPDPVRWRDRVDVITHDLTAPFSQQAASRIGALDYLVAMASESHVDRSISDPVPFVRNNVDVILHTLELARLLKPRVVIVVSTDEVYGPVQPGYAHPEWAPIIPSNPYAASKAAQEAVAISYWRTYGVPVILVNCMNMFGERMSPEKFVPKVIRAVLAGDEILIHGTPGDIGTRHWLHARNLADGILFLLGQGAPAMFPAHAALGAAPAADRPDRYNVASPDRVSNLDLALMIAANAKHPLKYRLTDFHSARPGHDPHYGLDSSKLADLGWKPPVEFRESLERTVHWTIAHQNWLLDDA